MPKEKNNKKLDTKKKTKKGTRIGTRNKYEYWISEEGLNLLEGWARDGLIDEDIAKKMGIVASTLYEWKKKYPKLSEALKNGKEVIDNMVENALLKRALGYEYEEIKQEEGQTSEGYINKKTVTKKIIVADTTAQIFWLKNRRPDKWQNHDKFVVEDNTEEIDMHKATLMALKNRIIPELEESPKEVVNNG